MVFAGMKGLVLRKNVHEIKLESSWRHLYLSKQLTDHKPPHVFANEMDRLIVKRGQVLVLSTKSSGKDGRL